MNKFARWCLLLWLCVGAVANAALPRVDFKLAYPELTFNRPIWLSEAPDNSGRIFVVEQTGKIKILPKDRSGREASVFLDISERKPHASNEEGLLALAFHPQFKSNGKFYTFYTQQKPARNLLSEWHVSKTDPNSADMASERILLEVKKPYPNHNGSTLMFGRDGFLYVSLGDGGSANDPHNNGQSLTAILGKILRIDVDSKSAGLEYGIPKDNPFVGQGNGVREEIWAYGLRNVWRMSFDRQTGELWAGDVGQNKWEEVDVIVKGGNYGWRIREGLHVFDTNAPPSETKYIDPVFEYDRTKGNSMTGGFVYRGQKSPALRGLYLCADFTTGTIFAVKREGDKTVESGVLFTQPKGLIPLRNISSFGEDAKGELYVLVFEGIVNGRIYELEAAAEK